MENPPGIAPAIKGIFSDIGELSFFAGHFFRNVFKRPFEFKELLKQCYNIGNRSLLLVSVTGFIIGLVFTMQSRPTLEQFGAASWMASMVSISLIREIGPIITALIVAGRVSSGIGAELGAMRVSEQIDSMEVSGTNPFKYLVITRIVAATLMLPILVLLSDAIAIYGSFLVESFKGNVSMQLYFSQVFDALKFSDLIPATIKTFFFGFAIGLVGCFKGYTCKKGTAGVGIAANTAVVLTSMLLFFLDFVAVFITSIFS
ncbi:MAG: ABC transporter permease [Flavobacterium sp.]|nr:MAG: ABC transporter permease [Flavobacterium sp.]